MRELTDGRGVDVVLAMAGGEIVAQALDTLATFRRMVWLGQSSGKAALVNPWQLTLSTVGEIIGFIMAGKLSIQVATL